MNEARLGGRHVQRHIVQSLLVHASGALDNHGDLAAAELALAIGALGHPVQGMLDLAQLSALDLGDLGIRKKDPPVQPQLFRLSLPEIANPVCHCLLLRPWQRY